MKYETNPAAMMDALMSYQPEDAALAAALDAARALPGQLAVRDAFDALNARLWELDEPGQRLIAALAHQINLGRLYGRELLALNVLLAVVPGLPDEPVDVPPPPQPPEN